MAPVTTAAPQTRKLNYADFVLIPDDGHRHEIIDGVDFASPSPRTAHQRALATLGALLVAHVKANRLGEIFFAPFDVLLSEHDILQPDLLFICSARAAILNEDNVKGAPDLLVEILSPGTRRRDETLKRDRYGKLGVAEYWMVDTGARTVRVVQWNPDAERLLGGAGILTSTLLPGFVLPLQELFTR